MFDEEEMTLVQLESLIKGFVWDKVDIEGFPTLSMEIIQYEKFDEEMLIDGIDIFKKEYNKSPNTLVYQSIDNIPTLRKFQLLAVKYGLEPFREKGLYKNTLCLVNFPDPRGRETDDDDISLLKSSAA